MPAYTPDHWEVLQFHQLNLYHVVDVLCSYHRCVGRDWTFRVMKIMWCENLKKWCEIGHVLWDFSDVVWEFGHVVWELVMLCEILVM